MTEIFKNALGVLCGVVAMDVAMLAAVRRRWIAPSPLLISAFLILLVGAGTGILWIFAAGFRLPAVSLYWTGSLVYMEIRSLLSRGYSLRILVDLLHEEGRADVDTLKKSYGEGKGIPGLLTKRIQTLENFRLLKCEGNRVGPLTPWGRRLAWAGHLWRKTLRLDQVG